MSKSKDDNREIRERIAKGRFYYWEVAQAVGISPSCLSCWLREELTGERLTRVLAALDTLEGGLHNENH